MIEVYRQIGGVEVEVCKISTKKAMLKKSIMSVMEYTVKITTPHNLNIIEDDYVRVDGVIYKLNRGVDVKQKSSVEYVYTLIFEHPLYTLLDKLYVHKVSRKMVFYLTGKLADFVSLVVWNVNKTPSNTEGVDVGWSVGSIEDTEYKTLYFTNSNCREVLDQLADEFSCEFVCNNKELNFYKKIERVTSHIFEQGEGKGLYEFSQRNVDKKNTVTRLYVTGGSDNVPNEYANASGELKLPENYLEKFTEYTKIVEAHRKFEEVFPHFKGSVDSVSGSFNSEIICSQINFNVNEIAIGDEARINFLTGDLMGSSFRFRYYNIDKKIILVKQDDEMALPENGIQPTIPSAVKKAKQGDLFNFTGVRMPKEYVDDAITELREKGQKWLDFHSKVRKKYVVKIDHRYMRNKPRLDIGDLVLIKNKEENINKLIRIVSLEMKIDTGEIKATISNYLEDDWNDYEKDRVEEMRNKILVKQKNLKNTLISIFQDGIITASERNTIESALTSMKTEYSQFTAQYLVYSSQDISNKETLNTAYNQYKEIYLSTSNEIVEAVADGKITNEEKVAIDNGIDNYIQSLGVVTTELDKARILASKNIKIGGHNLILSSKQSKKFYQLPAEKRDRYFNQTLTYTFSADATATGDIADAVFYCIGKRKDTGAYEVIGKEDVVLEGGKEKRIKCTTDFNISLYTKLTYKCQNAQNTIPVSLKNPKLELGEIATDYDMADEDLGTAENTQIGRIEALERRTDFLNSTEIDGNAIATGTLMVGNGSGANAGICGLKDIPKFFAGSGISNANTAPFRVYEDGSAHMTKGTIGGIDINENGIGKAGGNSWSGKAMFLNEEEFDIYQRIRIGSPDLVLGYSVVRTKIVPGRITLESYNPLDVSGGNSKLEITPYGIFKNGEQIL